MMQETAKYYPFDQHKIIVDTETNAKFWSITGSNLQFTWFEVLPGTLFKTHTHNSEQITHVLSGELFFKIENTVYRLYGGDSVTIPSNIEHTVWTEDLPAVAVDAWSPVNEKYNSQKK
jgi:quercetin dioxygenase-like cupin family protein